MEKKSGDRMTFQIAVTKYCLWCNMAMNTYGDRGNGKERRCCDRICGRKMYNFKKIFDNTIAQLQLMGDDIPQTGELNTEVKKFMTCLNDYLELGMRADVVIPAFEAMVEGRNCSTLDFIFTERIQLGRRMK